MGKLNEFYFKRYPLNLIYIKRNKNPYLFLTMIDFFRILVCNLWVYFSRLTLAKWQ